MRLIVKATPFLLLPLLAGSALGFLRLQPEITAG